MLGAKTNARETVQVADYMAAMGMRAVRPGLPTLCKGPAQVMSYRRRSPGTPVELKLVCSKPEESVTAGNWSQRGRISQGEGRIQEADWAAGWAGVFGSPA